MAEEKRTELTDEALEQVSGGLKSSTMKNMRINTKYRTPEPVIDMIAPVETGTSPETGRNVPEKTYH